jgi:hypothetical protein
VKFHRTRYGSESACATVAIEREYKPSPRGGLRSYVDGYRVEDRLTGQVRHVVDAKAARSVAEDMLARRSKERITGAIPAHIRVDIQVVVDRKASASELTGGLFSVAYTVEVAGQQYNSQWWTELRPFARRLAHVEAYAYYRARLMTQGME